MPLIGGEYDCKSKKSYEKQLSCLSCKSYMLTHSSISPKGYIFWENISKPDHFVLKDISSLTPTFALPTIYCVSCKEPFAEAAVYRKGDILKTVYRIVSGKQNKSK
jgi:hypothetical protein